jgi:hypothetical protein
VKLVITTGRATATVARELDVGEAALGRRVIAFKARNEAGPTFGDEVWMGRAAGGFGMIMRT